MIFLTVGSEFHFDRLVMAIDRLIADSVLTEDVIAQIGHGGYEPRHMQWVPTMTRSVYAQHVLNSSGVVSHAGMGTVIECIHAEKPLLVMPRLKRHGEHVNDHQVGTARMFDERGSVLVAYDTSELPVKLDQLKTFRSTSGTSGSRKALTDRINQFLSR